MIDIRQKRAPLAEAMKAYAKSGALAFHTPGHKQGLGAHKLLKELISPLGLKEEVSLMDELDDPSHPEGCIKEAQELAAQLYGADYTFFMVNGTTGAIHTMLMAALRPGDKILVPRCVHRSVMGGLILTGAVPIYLPPVVDERLGIVTGVTVKAVTQMLDRHPDVKGMLMVYPNYYGLTCDLEGIADELHRRGKFLLVDEAHGAHLRFSDELPSDAMACGADMAAQSTHKLLGSLTQTSMLHLRTERFSYEQVRRTAAILASTSPDYLLLASLDIARLQMAEEGRERIARALKSARWLRREINKIEGLWCFGLSDIKSSDSGVTGMDELKLTVQVSGLGLTGHAAERILRNKYLLQCELVDMKNVLFIISMADTEREAGKLLTALQGLAFENKGRKPLELPKIAEGTVRPEMVLAPREAFLAPQQVMNFSEAAGQISAEEITFYPPGIPIICPGERLDADILALVREMADLGLRVTGTADTSLEKISVIRMEKV